MRSGVDVVKAGILAELAERLLRSEKLADGHWQYQLWRLKDGKFWVIQTIRYQSGRQPSRIVGEFDCIENANIRFESYVGEFVVCEICGDSFKQIPHSHLAFHGISTKEYKDRFPGVVLMSGGERVRLHEEMWNNEFARYAHSDEHKKKVAEASNRLWADPTYIHNCSEGNHRAKKKAWKNPVYVQKMLTAWKRMPSKAETKLIGILKSYFPGEWEYTGDGGWALAGLIPDFININGRKSVIELNGCYWHACSECGFGSVVLPNGLSADEIRQRDIEKEATFTQCGFQVITIWEHELKDVTKVMESLK